MLVCVKSMFYFLNGIFHDILDYTTNTCITYNRLEHKLM